MPSAIPTGCITLFNATVDFSLDSKIFCSFLALDCWILSGSSIGGCVVFKWKSPLQIILFSENACLLISRYSHVCKSIKPFSRERWVILCLTPRTTVMLVAHIQEEGLMLSHAWLVMLWIFSHTFTKLAVLMHRYPLGVPALSLAWRHGRSRREMEYIDNLGY